MREMRKEGDAERETDTKSDNTDASYFTESFRRGAICHGRNYSDRIIRAHVPEENQAFHILFVESRRTQGFSSERDRIGQYNARSMTSSSGYFIIESFPN